VRALARQRNPKPFEAAEMERDARVPERLWELPERVARANAAGPRYNQTELAENSQLSQSVISKIANRSNLYGIRLETIYKLAQALDVSVPWILGETKTMTRRRPPTRVRAATLQRGDGRKRSKRQPRA
jgi:DNA-binding Xre family transcriptional regulator